MRAHPVSARKAGFGVLLLAVLAALLTSCAAGQRAQTAEEVPSIDGTEAQVGNIDLRGLSIQSPDDAANTPTAYAYHPGDDAVVNLVLVNNGRRPDYLTSISTPAASGWAAYASATTLYKAQIAVASQSAAAASSSRASSSAAAASSSAAALGSSASGPQSTSSSASSSMSPTLPGSGSSRKISGSQRIQLPRPLRAVEIPPGGTASFGMPDSTAALLLHNITQTLRPGNSVSIRFTFAQAGEVTAQVPVQLSQYPNASTLPAAPSPDQVGD